MIRHANINDLDILSKYDKHISKDELVNAINLNRIIVMYENDKFIGWLRYNLFWDNTPFMNMLYFLDNERGKGNGSKLIKYWEDEIYQKRGYCLTKLYPNAMEEVRKVKPNVPELGDNDIPLRDEIELEKQL